MNTNDTIAAIATPQGSGALGVIRVSGNEAIEKVNRLFPSKNLLKQEANTLHVGKLVYEGDVLDEAVISLFKSPRSYTGDDVVELSCHGSSYVLRSVMEALLKNGVRHADAGEFTLRAFLNGKMDLSQAEGVADLIASKSSLSREMAMNQMRGGFSQKIKELREQLLHLSSMLELELDFSEEDVEFANRDELKKLLTELHNTLSKLLESYKLGNVIKEGLSVVIAGRPNAGKSTLLNALLEDERAIVSDIPGTTRDTIEDSIMIEGILFRFMDTAGIRESEDRIEKIGVERTMQSLNKADLIIYLFDAPDMRIEELKADLDKLPSEKARLVVGNKSDKGLSEEKERTMRAEGAELLISSKDQLALDQLKNKLVEQAGVQQNELDRAMVTNLRHYEALEEALKHVNEVEQGMQNDLPSDLISVDIRMALNSLSAITGEISNDEVLGSIFSKFCIGK